MLDDKKSAAHCTAYIWELGAELELICFRTNYNRIENIYLCFTTIPNISPILDAVLLVARYSTFDYWLYTQCYILLRSSSYLGLHVKKAPPHSAVQHHIVRSSTPYYAL